MTPNLKLARCTMLKQKKKPKYVTQKTLLKSLTGAIILPQRYRQLCLGINSIGIKIISSLAH